MSATRFPARIKTVLARVRRGEIIPALPLLDLPSTEYQAVLKRLKLAGYEYHPGSGNYYKDKINGPVRR